MAQKNKHICLIASDMNCCTNILVYTVNHLVNHDGFCFIKTFTILRLRWEFGPEMMIRWRADMYSQIISVMGLINCTLFSITFKNADWCASGKTIVCMNVVILVFQTPLAGLFILSAHAAPVLVLRWPAGLRGSMDLSNSAISLLWSLVYEALHPGSSSICFAPHAQLLSFL